MGDPDRIVIGIAFSTSPRMPEFHKAVEDAGSVLYEIPEYVASIEQAQAVLQGLDAIIIPGAGVTNPVEGKASDVMLIQAARAMGMPILGICHGHQYINKALGGKIGKVAVYYSDALDHSGHINENSYHTVSVERDSFLYKINGGKTEMSTNSNHSYCISPKAIVPELKVVSYSTADNVIEAVESEDGKAIGVQWHPEVMYSKYNDLTSLEIFRYLVRLAADYRTKKSQ